MAHAPTGRPSREPSVDDIWLTATWPFVRGQLPAAPAVVAELGCGTAGGHVPALLRAGYHATGVDPQAPEGRPYRRMAFEDYRPDGPVDAVIASVSLHHVDDLAGTVGRLADILTADGKLVVVEWISEDFDEATARWCFGRRPRDPDGPGAWLADRRAEWTASGLPWGVFVQGWLDGHGLHPAAAIRQALEARFVPEHLSVGPYYFPDLLDADADAERAAIDAGEIRPGCLLYAGRPAPRQADRGR